MINTKIRWKRIASAALFPIAMSLAATNLGAQETSRKVISNPAPVYPDTAKRFRVAGTVKVQVVIGADGSIKDVKVVGGHPLLVSAVQDTLKNWKYAPANTETSTTLQFNFHE